jgi:hypothetical protein
VTEAGEAAAPRPRRAALALALAAVVLSFVPFVGLAVAVTAVVRLSRQVRRGAATRGALSIALLGAVLSAAYTAGYVACAPSQESPGERRTWREFDRLFGPESPSGAGNPQGNPGSPPPAP